MAKKKTALEKAKAAVDKFEDRCGELVHEKKIILKDYKERKKQYLRYKEEANALRHQCRDRDEKIAEMKKEIIRLHTDRLYQRNTIEKLTGFDSKECSKSITQQLIEEKGW